MYTREGYSDYFDIGNTDPITTLTKWTDDLYVLYIQYKKIAVYRISTNTHTVSQTQILLIQDFQL